MNSVDIDDWIKQNKKTTLPLPIILHNYWTPLTHHVKGLNPIKTILSATQPSHKRVCFTLPIDHANRDRTHYQKRTRRPHEDNNKTKFIQASPSTLRTAVLNKSVPLAVSNTGATSHTLLPSAPLIPTNTILTAVFHLPDGAMAAATKIHKLHHKLREPACTVNIVPSLMGISLLGTVKWSKQATPPSTTTARSMLTIQRRSRSAYPRWLSSPDTYALDSTLASPSGDHCQKQEY